ncbi:Aspartate racemase [Sphingobacterium sp. JB170]|nr:Aspartate racemase [Sphingobacterium sp. JB170]
MLKKPPRVLITKKRRDMIGIVGGVGPLAGLDILTKIIEETQAQSDQDHLPVHLFSQPQKVAETAAYGIKQTGKNPAYAIVEIIQELERIGATSVAIPYHDAHAPLIFNVILEELKNKNSRVTILNMIKETVKFVKDQYAGLTKIGVLSANCARNGDLYAGFMEENNLTAIIPNAELQKSIDASVYNETYGIKTISSPVSNRARQELLTFIMQLKKDGAQAVILGGVEFTLAVPDKESAGIPNIDPYRVLARALISATSPEKLRPL